MPIETFNFIDSLNTANPGSTDDVLQGDDHIRGLKSVLKNNFPNITAAITATAAQINQLASGVIGFADAGWNYLSETSLGIQRSAAGVMTIVGGKLTGNGAVPTGMIADFLQTSIPTGWHELNGQAVSRTGATAALFALYGTGYGAGDGSTTFNLPNLTDRYRRSRGTSAVGAFQAASVESHTHGADAVPGHLHTVNFNSGSNNVNGFINIQLGSIQASGTGAAFQPFVAGGSTPVDLGTHTHVVNGPTDTQGGHTPVIQAYGGSETRPVSIVVVSCVKA